ncbi:MAG TPA: DUF881 domain-containing protein [Kineosporiaceae bacterium]
MSAGSTDAARRGLRRPSAAAVGVFVGFGLAGLLLATSANTARGTQLRPDRTDVAGLIRSENAKRAAEDRRLASLHAEVDALTATAAGGDSEVARLRQQADGVAVAAGLAPVQGHGLVVTLDDAPAGGTRPAGAQPDDLVVHQQDVQGVVNALWAGGAGAMMLMDQRVISTSAVRCVGNTLLLQGRLYPPPYRIAAIGNVAQLRKAMAASPTIPIYLEYKDRYGLGWNVEEKDLAMPGYGGPLTLRYARVPHTSAGASASPSSASPSPSAASPSGSSTSGSSASASGSDAPSSRTSPGPSPS